MKPYRCLLSLVRLAARATVVAALGVATSPGMAAEDDMRVVGRMVIPIGSGDWGFGFVAGTVAQERGADEFTAMPGPRVDLTAWFSGSSGRFQGLSFNGMRVVAPEPVLHADGAENTAPGVRWEYVALGVAGVAVLAWAIADDLWGAVDRGLDEAADD